MPRLESHRLGSSSSDGILRAVSSMLRSAAQLSSVRRISDARGRSWPAVAISGQSAFRGPCPRSWCSMRAARTMVRSSRSTVRRGRCSVPSSARWLTSRSCRSVGPRPAMTTQSAASASLGRVQRRIALSVSAWASSSSDPKRLRNSARRSRYRTRIHHPPAQKPAWAPRSDASSSLNGAVGGTSERRCSLSQNGSSRSPPRRVARSDEIRARVNCSSACRNASMPAARQSWRKSGRSVDGNGGPAVRSGASIGGSSRSGRGLLAATQRATASRWFRVGQPSSSAMSQRLAPRVRPPGSSPKYARIRVGRGCQ